MAKYSKLYMALMAMAAVIGESVLIPEQVRLYVQLGTAVVAAGGVWYFPNVTAPQGAHRAVEPARDAADTEQDVDQLEVG